ncbi:hypothetical protein COM90_22540 [Bacillus thuringiensis]|uniref:DUF4231 domain-containing protein n=1 Tax=Bacillus thuringiensis TaxID=1428 RepID=A0AB36TSS7_BACTU|nr:SLATT domain-containing protein [Bacillus thuringiensis]PEE66212.1 hypothetical protein COM74_04310 [Bacillus thuringiensis]PEE86588.1 hypothetical protein COM90_22540 [Bacillus thuringiensis]PFM88077.1 hypothetical protein COJ61_22250 [Bacillus thuringiensis]
MEVKMKKMILLKNVNDSIEFFDKRRNKNKKKAFILKISSVIASAVITVLLGLKSLNNNILSDITLVLAAGVTVFNGIDSFYNHRGLWEKDVRTLSSLRELQRNIEYYIVCEKDNELSLKVLDEFQDNLQIILREDINTWSDVRGNINTPEKSSEKSSE